MSVLALIHHVEVMRNSRPLRLKESICALILAGLGASCVPTPIPPQFSEDQSPAFSPDGQSIAYVHRDFGFARPGSYPSGIYTLDLLRRRVVPRYLGFARTVDWSRDGHKLIFDDPVGIHTLDTTTSATELIFIGDAYFPSCALHADTVAFDNLADVGLVPLTAGSPVFPPSLNSSRDPAWSPDGSRLALSRAFQGAAEELCVITRQTGAIARITNNQYPDRYPSWSHDGTRLAWNALTSGLAGTQLAVAALAGGGTTFLTQADGAPDWAPDDLTIAFPRYEGERTRIYTIELSTGALTPISP